MPAATAEGGKEIGFDIGERRGDQFTPWNRDDVERGAIAERAAMTAEQIAQPPFGAIARDGGPQLARGNETEARRCAIIRKYQQRDEASGDAPALLLHAHEIGAPADAIACLERK